MINVPLVYQRMFASLGETLTMVFAASLIALLIGLPIGCLLYLSAKAGLAKNRVMSSVLNAFVNITRSIPFLIFVILLIPFTRSIVGTGFGTQASIVPLSIIGIALYARLVEQSLLDVHVSVIETGISMGATTFQTMRYIVLREAAQGLVLGFTSIVISLLSYSTVMGIVGGGGVGDFAIIYGYQSNRMDVVIVAVIVLIVLVQAIQILGSRMARTVDKKRIKERRK